MADTPLWLRVLKPLWAGLIVLALAFSITMAAWGDLRESLMLRMQDSRHTKSLLLQFPMDANVAIGAEHLGYSWPHPLARTEPFDPELEVEGMSIALPRVYLREEQIHNRGTPWTPGEEARAMLARLEPNAEVLWLGEEDAGFMPVLLAHGGRIDYALLVTLELPGKPAAFLLRAELKGARVFKATRQEVWSDQLWAPEGFWAKREQWQGLPPVIEGQTKTVWRWHFEFEPEEANWRKANVPHEYSEAAWTDLPTG